MNFPDVYIFQWMTTDLKLSGNKLLLYSLFFSWDKEFDYGLKYIYRYLDCSKTTAIKTIQYLIDNDLVIKKVTNYGNTICYSINFNKIKNYLT